MSIVDSQSSSQVTGVSPFRQAPFWQAMIDRNPAWAQLLGLCPLLAVTNSAVNALGLAAATLFVILGSNVLISTLRHHIPDVGRLPVFVLVIATFTTCVSLLLEAFAFDLYLKIALFVQIIVTNCMILARVEQFASRQSVPWALLDALATALGFALALIGLGLVRELLATGHIGLGLDALFGPSASTWSLELLPAAIKIPIAALPPGAFIVAGLLLGIGNAWQQRQRSKQASDTEIRIKQ